MKIRINKKIRIALISVLIILISLTTYLTYNKISNPGTEEQKFSVYSYSNNGSINYTVYLKTNNLYKDNKLEEGKVYITEFVDHIDTDLKYEFTGERAADIKAEYNIIAKVQGFTGEGEKLINIWEKDFPIVQNKTINSYENKISINKKIKLNLNEYNTFVEQIKEASKINCQAALTLSMNVNLTGSTDELPIEESISPSLIIPLDVAMFEITSNNITDQPGTIEKTDQVQLLVNTNQVIFYGIILAIFIVALIILIFFTQIASDKDPFEKEISRIFKKYGDRLVALNSEINVNDSKNVKSIEDLVKIADEIEKPILYKYCENYKEINKFYVSDVDEIFLLNLVCLDKSEQTNDTKDIISKNISEQINTESQLNG